MWSTLATSRTSVTAGSSSSPRDLFRLKLSDDGQRVTIVTDIEQQIFMSYDGVIAHSEQSAAKMASGTPITHADAAYFVVAPTFRTGAEKYAVQAVGKMVQHHSIRRTDSSDTTIALIGQFEKR
jgi:uncharacterized protein DUF3237